MRYSIVLVATLMAAVGIATPVNVQKRGYVYQYETVYVTKTQTHPYTHRHGWRHHRKHKNKPVPVPAPTPDYEYSYGDYQPDVPKKSPKEDKPKKKTPKEDKPKEDTPKDSPSAPSDFAKQCLDSHNKYRAQHDASPLEWDETMANHAEGVSATCIFEHSGSSYGENLAAGYDSPDAAITAWYDEKDQYNGDFSSAAGHFSQLVWKGAKKVGCGQVDCAGKNGTPGKFFTCNYDTGNVIGSFKENVQP